MRRVTETITPERAAELLKTGKKEALSKSKVNTFASKMLFKKWHNNGDYIYIRNGKLLNGHHRLEAVVVSGVTVEMKIQYDC